MEDRRASVGNIFLASAISGSISRLLLHPLDTLRARLQNERSPKLLGDIVPLSVTKSTSTAGLFKNMLEHEGWASLYKGLGVAITFGLPGTMIYLTTYEKLKEKLLKSGVLRDSYSHLTAAFFAECVSGLVWTPMDVVKQKLQVEESSHAESKYKNSTNAIKMIFREEGTRGLYRGYFANLSVFAPFSMIYFVAYEKLKLHFGHNYISYISSAFIAGVVASATTSPLDVVKTRLQVQSQHSAVQYSSIAQAIMRMLREEGLKVFSKGLLARVLWVASSTAVNLSIFETLKDFVNS